MQNRPPARVRSSHLDWPSSKLLAGGIGSFLLTAAFLIAMISFASVGARFDGASVRLLWPVEGLMFLALLLLLAGYASQSLGWFGLANLYGGLNGQTGLLGMIIGAAMMLGVLLGLVGLGGEGLGEVIALIVSFAVGLSGLGGGIGLLATRGQAHRGGRALQLAGALLLVGGGACFLMMLLAVSGVLKGGGGAGVALLWVAAIGLTAGHAATGVAMLGLRAAER